MSIYWSAGNWWCGDCERPLMHWDQVCLWCHPIPALPPSPVHTRNGWTVEITQTGDLIQLTMHHKLNPNVRYHSAVKSFVVTDDYESGTPTIYEINGNVPHSIISWEPLF